MLFKKPSIVSEESASFIKKLLILTVFLGILLFIYNISSILVILFFALFLNILFSPLLNILNKYHIGDWLGIILIYLIIIIFLVIVFFAIIPIFIKQINFLIIQTGEYVGNLKTIYESKGVEGLGVPYYLRGLLENVDLNGLLESIKNNMKEISLFISNNLKKFLSSGAGIIFSFTTAIFHLLMVFIFAFFIALERKGIREFFYKILPSSVSKYMLSKEDKIVGTLSNWFRGQIILGITMFCLTLIGLLVIRLFGIKINEFFSLALIAGMMEFVPYIGPLIALLPALALAMAFGVKGIIIILVLYIGLQQIENNFLVPYIMSKSLSLSPFAVLLGMTIGASLMGVVGIIIAIPIVSIVQVFLSDYLTKKSKQATK